jgi:hypothetical protein
VALRLNRPAGVAVRFSPGALLNRFIGGNRAANHRLHRGSFRSSRSDFIGSSWDRGREFFRLRFWFWSRLRDKDRFRFSFNNRDDLDINHFYRRFLILEQLGHNGLMVCFSFIFLG